MYPRQALERLHEYVPGERRAGVLKLSSNENPLGPSPRAIEQLRSSAAEAHIYPDGAARQLRERLARQLSVPADQVITGNGSDELMVYAAAAYLNPGDIAVIARHTFSVYAFATNLFDGRVITTEMPHGRHDPDAFVATLRAQPRTRLLFVCNPNNPTGTCLSRGELEHILDQTPAETLVILDEAYCEYMDPSDASDGPALIRRYPNLLVLRTFSKIYGLAGLRVGYGMAQREIIRTLNKVKLPFNTSLVAQAAAAAALDDDGFVRRSLETNLSGRGRLYGELERRGLTYYRTQANFICINVRSDARAFAEQMAANGVTIRPLTSFGLDDCIRVTIGTGQQIDAFLRALDSTLASIRRSADAPAD
ncbi:MAG: histidinol-phosphate transaminase [Spirochaetaceae bacterium]|nr:MAG: histidinol-phosphate transaminase [Spirochaetaceae bacterium]